MERLAPIIDYFIWGIDDFPYGPVQLPVLLDWINEERVLPDTLIFTHGSGTWQRASDVPELASRFQTAEEDLSKVLSPSNFRPSTLRRVKILADLKDVQLAQLAGFLEFKHFPRGGLAVRRGKEGDAMFLILDGGFRARMPAHERGRNAVVATFGPGDSFGETALFGRAPAPADIIASRDSAVLRLSAVWFEQLTHEAPNLATPFLQAISRSLTASGAGVGLPGEKHPPRSSPARSPKAILQFL